MTARREFDALAEPLPQGRMLLEASAGTGKTHTITSLVLRMVAEGGYELPRLLIVTFTRAAAAELRERVRTRLAAAARAVEHAAMGAGGEAGDDVVRELIQGAHGDAGRLHERAWALRRASEQLDEATITTIHGFCQRTLTVSAMETGVDFDADLLEDERQLLSEVVDDLYDRHLRRAEPDWYAHLRDVAKIERAELEHAAREAVAGSRPRLLPDPDTGAEDPRAAWGDACARFREVWTAHRADLADELWACTGNPGLKGWRPHSAIEGAAEAIDQWLASGPPLPRESTWQEACGIGWLLGRFRNGPERGVHDVLDAAIDVVDAVTQQASLLMARLARDAAVELDARKHHRQLIAFDDQLRHLRAALEDDTRRDDVIAGIRARYDAALIDEFQDTDPLQWGIFAAAFGDAPLVLIGDPKQAIYGFRGADLPTYLNAAETVADSATLPTNWRSDQRYVDAVNAVFAAPGSFGVEGIEAPQVRAHHQTDRLRWPDGRPRPTLRLRYVPHAAAEATGGVHQNKITKWWAHRYLPRDVTEQTRTLLESLPTVPDDDGGQRPLKPGDVAVLVATNRQARLVHQQLMGADIPATLTRAGSVFATTETDELLRLLEALAEPAREPLARAAAATRLFGWQATDLIDPDTAAAWDAWVDKLRDWERSWREGGVMTALRTVFADQAVWAGLLRTPDGERAVANLWHLAERLHAVEQTERLGPASLIGWLRAARDEAHEDETAQASENAELRLERDDAAVQVITVHGSKGLQFPVVLCPFLWDGRLLRDPEKKVLRFHDEHHDDRRTLDLHRNHKGEPKAAHMEMAERQRHAESLRLAYVALTRAEHHAIVWWGRFTHAETSPLAGLLHRGPDEPPYQAGQAALQRGDDDLRADLDALAGRSGGVIGVETVDAAPRHPPAWSPADDEPRPADLDVATFDRQLDRAWRRTSFTALTRRASGDDHPSGEMGREDDEADRVDLDDADEAGGGPALPLADLPRGPQFGDAVHHILEAADFTVPVDAAGGLGQAVDRQVVRSPALTAAHRDALVEGLEAMLATPLGADLDDAALGDVAPSDRLDELAFELPLAGGTSPDGAVTLQRLEACLRRHPDGTAAADALAALGHAPPVRGFLTGSVDLLARLTIDGRPRFLVVDYKTTWLGDRRQSGDGERVERSSGWHYRPEALQAAMGPHGYELQALLYLVAVHRYLRSRLAGYDPDRDLAGVAYLFVRGMAGPESCRADGRTDGVWRWRPSAALITDVNEVLATGRETRP